MAVELNLLITLPLLTAIYLLTKHLLHKLHNLPPTLFPNLPIIGHLHLLKNPLHHSLATLSKTHRQPILLLRFGSRNVLHFASPTAAEECLSKNDVVFANRPRLLSGKYFGYNYTSLPWAPYGPHWQNLRRISAVEILSSTRLDSLSHVRLDEIRAMVHKFFSTARNKNNSTIYTSNNNTNSNRNTNTNSNSYSSSSSSSSNSNSNSNSNNNNNNNNSYSNSSNNNNNSNSPDQVVKLRAELSAMMFNIMTRMMGGKRYFGNLDGGEEEEAKRFSDVIADTERVISESKILDMLPNFRWLFAGRFEKRFAAVQKSRDDFMQVWINEFREGGLGDGEGKKEKTLLQILLCLQDAEPEYYTDEMIKSLSQERTRFTPRHTNAPFAAGANAIVHIFGL